MEKTVTMVLFGIAVGVATFAGVALGSVLGDLGMSIGNIAATSALQVLVGLVFGALALALGAGIGRTSIAVFGAAGAALAFHLLTSLAAINDGLAGIAWLSPFHYYLGSDPLNNGMDWETPSSCSGWPSRSSACRWCCSSGGTSGRGGSNATSGSLSGRGRLLGC